MIKNKVEPYNKYIISKIEKCIAFKHSLIKLSQIEKIYVWCDVNYFLNQKSRKLVICFLSTLELYSIFEKKYASQFIVINFLRLINVYHGI